MYEVVVKTKKLNDPKRQMSPFSTRISKLLTKLFCRYLEKKMKADNACNKTIVTT